MDRSAVALSNPITLIVFCLFICSLPRSLVCLFSFFCLVSVLQMLRSLNGTIFYFTHFFSMQGKQNTICHTFLFFAVWCLTTDSMSNELHD